MADYQLMIENLANRLATYQLFGCDAHFAMPPLQTSTPSSSPTQSRLTYFSSTAPPYQRYQNSLSSGTSSNQSAVVGQIVYRFCSFCKSNGEPFSVYESHVLRDTVTDKLLCPYLRRITCRFCGATGDNAHTASYCPKKPDNAPPPFSKSRSKRTADGKLRSKNQRVCRK